MIKIKNFVKIIFESFFESIFASILGLSIVAIIGIIGKKIES